MLTIPPQSNIKLSRTCNIKAVDFGDYVERTCLYPLREIEVVVPVISKLDGDLLLASLDILSGNTPTNLSAISDGYYLIQEVSESPLLYGYYSELSFKAVQIREFNTVQVPATPTIYYPALDGSSIDTIYNNYYRQYSEGTTVARNKGLDLKNLVWNVLFHLSPDLAISLDLLLASLRGIEPFIWSPDGDTSARLWICDRWSIEFTNDDIYIFNGNFSLHQKTTDDEQVFRLTDLTAVTYVSNVELIPLTAVTYLVS